MQSVAAAFPSNAVERDETLNRELWNAKPEQLLQIMDDSVDLVLFFSLRPRYAAVGDCCYPICCGSLPRIDIKSTESWIIRVYLLLERGKLKTRKMLNENFNSSHIYSS